ncbi:MAG: hypothetical protein IK052_07785, partial [Bacteroidales bacterium]|nr:hypothetical protein [Bacteroidales bacterium]
MEKTDNDEDLPVPASFRTRGLGVVYIGVYARVRKGLIFRKMDKKREIFWFALTVFKNLPGLVDAFSQKGWETFRAYTLEEKVEGTRIIRKEVPLVRSLLFVKCPIKELVDFKYKNNDWFMYYKDASGKDPGPVKDNEMKAFMLVTSIRDGNLRVLGEDR